MANIGIMDGAYFVSRTDIISWINDLLGLNISKVEEVRLYLGCAGFIRRSLSFNLAFRQLMEQLLVN